jgi:signal transduction histidine kinase
MWPGFVSYRFESDGICSLLYIGFLTLAGYVLFIDRKEMAATRRVEQIKDIHSKDLADIMNALCTAALESDNEKEPCLNGREPTEPTGTSPSGEELRQKFEQKRQAFRYATVLLEYTLANLKDPTKSRWDMRKLSAKTFVLNAIDQYSLVENDRRRLEIRTLDPDFHFLGNSDLLDAVLYNVLRNALRGIRKKSGGRVGIYFESCGEEAGIIIEDNGIGIDPVNIPYMFDPYDSTYRGGSFCKQAMLSMRGDIRCYSLPNEVTRLVLLFKVFS